MLDVKVRDLEEDLLDEILVDAFEYLISTFDDNSIFLNKASYTKKYTALKPVTFKHHLNLVWAYSASSIDWYYYGQYAEYDSRKNTINLHCSKKFTLAFVLDSLFHEYKHSQQRMTQYHYFRNFQRIPYDRNPLEIEANQFAELEVLKFWNTYEKKLPSK